MDWGFIVDQTLTAFVGLDAVVFVLAALGLNVQFGYAGLLNFGQAAFMAAGAYGLGMSANYWGVSWWFGILFGLVYATVLAVIVGIPTLRLRADYLAIVTIALAELVRLVVRSVTHKEKFGGSDGLKGFSDGFQNLNPMVGGGRYGIGPFQVHGSMVVVTAVFWIVVSGVIGLAVARRVVRRRERGDVRTTAIISGVVTLAVSMLLCSRVEFLGAQLWTLIVGWVLAGLCAVFVWALMRSPWGRVIKGIREDEDAVRSLGKNVFGYKMSSLVIGAVLGMLAGFLFALKNSNVQPDNYSRAVTFYVMTALVLGGLATVLGSIIGPMLFWALLAFTGVFLSELSDAQGRVSVFGVELLRDASAVLQFRLMLVGIALILLMVYRPQGIFGNRKEMALDGR
ncbi:MAG: branched-chain amino acid ABC transporter permease [Ilumatobacteraceae bacterium]|jgi:neutral amino acid transport system permease protein